MEQKPELAHARNKLIAFLHSRKMRQTPERFVILEHVMSMTSHFSVEIFHNHLETNGYHVSKATVYNTLQVFLEAGIVRRHNFEGPAEYERIEPGGHNHHHLVCTRCGHVKEVRDTDIADVIARHHYTGFEPSYFSLYVYGLCPQCRRKKSKSHK